MANKNLFLFAMISVINITNTLFVYDLLAQQLWQQLCHRSPLVLIKLKIKNYEKFTRHFHVKELEGHCRMALINRNMVTKNALDKEHPFFD